jgi:hypothetical protein
MEPLRDSDSTGNGGNGGNGHHLPTFIRLLGPDYVYMNKRELQEINDQIQPLLLGDTLENEAEQLKELFTGLALYLRVTENDTTLSDGVFYVSMGDTPGVPVELELTPAQRESTLRRDAATSYLGIWRFLALTEKVLADLKEIQIRLPLNSQMLPLTARQREDFRSLPERVRQWRDVHAQVPRLSNQQMTVLEPALTVAAERTVDSINDKVTIISLIQSAVPNEISD